TTCVRTGWSLASALFFEGYHWGEAHNAELFALWEKCIAAVRDGQQDTLPRADETHELICLDASIRALLCYLRSCPETLYTVPNCLTRSVALMEG
ncbi:unnamed protein product, partial [Chrysoparadoxa australica]